jgi:hypothetical protein
MLYQLSYARALPARPSGGGRIRTFVGRSRQIYSLLPLTARAPHQLRLVALRSPTDNAPRVMSRGVSCARACITRRVSSCDLHSGNVRADEGTRTLNLLITNQLLYQLSYVSWAAQKITDS